jgi:starch synthase
MKTAIFVAAENGALPGGKVGGVADVIRDLPAAVAELGWSATVLTPSYGSLHRLPGASRLSTIQTNFCGRAEDVSVWRVPGNQSKVRNIVLDHPRFVPTEPGVIYHQDPDRGPYATDAEKFAFFGAAAAAWIDALRTAPTVLHLHDWHTGVLAALREFDTTLTSLRQIKSIFTIHNLSYQGQRPFSGTDSSFENWFPKLTYERSRIVDPHADDCFNPMATCIRLADAVNTVSPSYQEEILRPSDAATGFIGGEGLESDINAAHRDGRLTGILNGCDYSGPGSTPLLWDELLDLCNETLTEWSSRKASESHTLAAARVKALPQQRPLHVVTSVGRIAAQKMALFFQPMASGRSALEEILLGLGSDDVLMLLGSGEARFEERILALAIEYPNLIFFHGYAERLGEALYSSGDLFLMPSSFEPCGISQMIAMKNGQPCVVHAVGGLKDTVVNGETGFVFDGETNQDKAKNFVSTTIKALTLRAEKPRQWETIRKQARRVRFEWSSSAAQYIEQLYESR